MAWWVIAKGFADEVRLFTDADLDPVELFNAQVFLAVRDMDPEVDAAALDLAQSLDGGRSLHDLSLRLGMQARGYRALLRLVRDEVLRPFEKAKITPETIVTRMSEGCDFAYALTTMNDHRR